MNDEIKELVTDHYSATVWRDRLTIEFERSWLEQYGNKPIAIDPETLNITVLTLAGCKELLSPPETLQLLPSPTDVRSRFEQFKELIFRCYKYINLGAAPVWDAGDAKQLHNLLRTRPELTKEQFREWLYNYMDSQNNNFADRPRKFLPNITSYANGPLDRYGKPIVVQKRRIL